MSERVPKIRFKEFERTGWEGLSLGEKTQWLSGGTPSKQNDAYWNGDIPWISASSMCSDILEESNLKITEAGLRSGSRLAPKDSILVLVRGSMLFNKVPIGIAGKAVAFNQDVKAVIGDETGLS